MADASNRVNQIIISTSTNYFIFLECVHFQDSADISDIGLE